MYWKYIRVRCGKNFKDAPSLVFFFSVEKKKNYKTHQHPMQISKTYQGFQILAQPQANPA